jgi:Arginine N-succinyltransferase beta subunit
MLAQFTIDELLAYPCNLGLGCGMRTPGTHQHHNAEIGMLLADPAMRGGAFWRHFCDMEFHEADRTNALNGNQFIGDLGPRYPLYPSQLPTTEQAALGRPHDEGQQTLDLIVGESFPVSDCVDIFDDGPTVYAIIASIMVVPA